MYTNVPDGPGNYVLTHHSENILYEHFAEIPFKYIGVKTNTLSFKAIFTLFRQFLSVTKIYYNVPHLHKTFLFQ